jgi:CubicO group peptidase (beta-lactamase class C family)
MEIIPFVKTIEQLKLNCEGIIVLQHGEKVAEYRWIPETPRNCFSVSKSFTSIAIGMAIDQGKLSLAEPVIDVFPEFRPGPDFEYKPGTEKVNVVLLDRKTKLLSLTLDNLLTMTRGHREFSRPATATEAIEQTLTYTPASRFVYDNGSTLLASAMFTRRMGATVREFLLDALFHPLGIPDPQWPESPDGHTIGGTGLMLTTSELAIFGQFLLQRGQWQGKQLVSPSWIDSAGRPHVKTRMEQPDNDLGYGYGFWPCRYGAYRADGKDGQFVIVLPRQNAVVAINSDEPEPSNILYSVWDEILPLLG